MSTVRAAAVAGLFYPDAPDVLAHEVADLLARAERPRTVRAAPRALVVPHAGYAYSGAAAASAWALLAAAPSPATVVLFGPPHRLPVTGLGLSSAAAFGTPLGALRQDIDLRERIAALAPSALRDDAHRDEHALEVQLPFLRQLLPAAHIVPLLVGDLSASAVARVMAPLWQDDSCLIVVSTDLSHFHSSDDAVAIDRATDAAIRSFTVDAIGPAQACGYRALNGLLHLARERGARIERRALTSSAATGGSRDRVVGYASYALYSAAP